METVSLAFRVLCAGAARAGSLTGTISRAGYIDSDAKVQKIMAGIKACL